MADMEFIQRTVNAMLEGKNTETTSAGGAPKAALTQKETSASLFASSPFAVQI